ncbi:hypothetical protein [Virgibacillus sp. Bac332]|uniref:hypothetical protein n=1 Tax=Virgibacillus sp. Bac332 TaxID=2419842 RepID=UPI001F09998B|nr:hypothetical protein [Virgibacillus sp. Bac332]
MSGLIAMWIQQNDLHALLWWTSICNFFQFIATITPVTYPRWMGAYYGHPSDGLQLLRLLK